LLNKAIVPDAASNGAFEPDGADMSNGIVLYRGPSMLDGSPIVVIATGTGKSSRNTKTGQLIQTWIMREDISPVDAIHSGADVSICGNCPHRGEIVDGRNKGRSCYVAVFQAPRNVWDSCRRGLYPSVSLDEARETFAGKRVRLGAYGDPAAVPFEVWQSALAETEAHTGYTHQWRSCDPRFASFVMASCDNQTDYAEAKARGYRTFRIRTADATLNKQEIVCPASKEAGFKTTCASCVACGGHEAKARADVAIVVHGTAANTGAFNRRLAA
jgi:hypothetical protein